MSSAGTENSCRPERIADYSVENNRDIAERKVL